MGNARNWRAKSLPRIGILAAAAVAAGLLVPASPAAARPTAARPTARPTAARPTARPTAAAAGAPVPVLRWHACTQAGAAGFQCASARVPLDYSVVNGRTIQIAVIRRLATDPRHRLGSLFINYGGPGGSGITSLPPTYRLLPAGLRQRFDIVSFDPRGINRSTAVQCFASAAAEIQFFTGMPEGFPVGPAEIRRWVAGAAELGSRCERRVGYLLPHIATADVARDMDLLRQAVGDRALNYLGLSYGSYLGATYANLFPGKVRALALDGAVTPTAWARSQRLGGVSLGTFLRVGTDLGRKATLERFLDLCGQASAGRCAFSAGTAPATRAKYATLLRRLRRGPVVVTVPGEGQVTMAYAGLVDTVANELYTVWPLFGPASQSWAKLAKLLETVWRAAGHHVPARAVTAGQLYPGIEQGAAVICADSPNPRNLASYLAQAALGYARSGAFGPDAAWLTEVCSTWPATDAHGYYGPWNYRTASPILVINTLYDPATPYPGAVGMTRELARARLLTVDGYGHTAFLNPSACVKRYEAAYFIDGKLPSAGTVCHQDKQPF